MKGSLAPACLIGALFSFSQTLAAQDTAEDTKGLLLEEVVVTAERREASLQDTEISISAFSAHAIQEMGISNVTDIGAHTPNLVISPFSGGKSGFAIAIRGVRQGNTLISAEPSVGLYADGVLISKNTGSLMDVLDLERIEVLRGPQGTLYGRNTIGGAVNLITKKPTDHFEGKLEGTLGSDNQQDIKGSVNIPLLGYDSAMGALKLRVAAASLNRDGLYRNVYPGALQKELDTRNRDAALVHLAWEPTDSLNLLYSYDYTKHDEVPLPLFSTFVNESLGVAAPGLIEDYLVPAGERPATVSFDGEQVQRTRVEGHALNIDYEFASGFTMTSISAWREMRNVSDGDSDGSPFALLDAFDDQQLEVFTQELRLAGEAFKSRMKFVLGAFYMDEKGSLFNGTDLDLSVALGLPVFMNTSLVTGDPSTFENEIWAVFGQFTYQLTDRFSLTGGLRYTAEDRRMSKSSYVQVAGATPTITPYPDAHAKFENVSPMVSLGYDFSDDVMGYAKVSRGYQSGGFNTRDAVPEDFARGFDEETLTAYELGLKSTFGSGRYRLNGAVFYSDYDDKQVNILIPDPPVRNTIRNAGAIEIYGLELEFVAKLTQGLELGLDYGYTQPRYKMFKDGAGQDLRHSNFQFAPKHTGHVYLGYEWSPLPVGLLSARVDWSYQDEINFQVPAPEVNPQGAYRLLNARVTLRKIPGPGGTSLRASLWGKNLTDEEYWTFGFDLTSTLGWASNIFGEARTYGLDLAIEF